MDILTPLLDWTESPYIAAYFAFRGDSSVDHQTCRVYALNMDELQRDSGSEQGALENPAPSLYPVRAATRDHNRALPQQSVFLLSNIVEIEVFLTRVEEQTHKRYLTKIDLRRASAKAALTELRLMGITEASLFPGLDGICKELRNRFLG